jgi:uncharacterized protein YoxC
MEEDAFTRFSAIADEASSSNGAAPPPRTTVVYQRPAPASPFASFSMVTWLILGGAILVIVTSIMYYWRRRQTTAESKASVIDALAVTVKQVQEEVDQLSQKQGIIVNQLSRVAGHSRSVEQGLGQALESWGSTIQQLRDEIEGLVEGVQEDEEQEAQAGAPQRAEDAERTDGDGAEESVIQ